MIDGLVDVKLHDFHALQSFSDLSSFIVALINSFAMGNISLQSISLCYALWKLIITHKYSCPCILIGNYRNFRIKKVDIIFSLRKTLKRSHKICFGLWHFNLINLNLCFECAVWYIIVFGMYI